MPTTYDKEKEDIRPKEDGSHDKLPGLKPHEIAAFDQMQAALKDGADSDKKPSKAVKREQESFDDIDDSGWFNNKKKKAWIKLSKKQAAAGAGGGLVLGGVMGMLLGLSGPLQLLHMGNLMNLFHFDNNSQMADGRLTKLYNLARGNAERNRLGAIGNHYADKFDDALRANGIEPNHRRGLTTLDFDTRNPNANRILNDLRNNGFEVPDTTPGSHIVTVDSGRGRGSARQLRANLDSIRKSMDLDGISGSLAGRMAKTRSGACLHCMRRWAREAGESFADYVRSVKQNYETRYREGGPGSPTRVPARTAAQDADDLAARARANGDTIGGQAPDLVGDGSPATIRTNLKRAFISTIGFFGVVEIACGLSDLGNGIQEIRQNEIVLPLIRMGVESISISSQLQVGVDITADELGAVASKYYGQVQDKGYEPEGGESLGKLSAFSADSIQAELGNQPIGKKGTDLSASSKPGRDKPAIFQGVDALTSKLPPGGCAAVQACLGPACVSDVLDAVVAFITDGASVTAAIATNLAFFGGGILAQDYIDSFVNWLAGAALQCRDGPEWGSCINYGAKLAANDQALSMGGTSLEPAEVDALRNLRHEEDLIEMKSKSLYARLLDPTETNSLFAKSFLENSRYTASTSNLSYFAQAPLSNFSNIFGSFGNILGGKAKALAVNYDYGFDTYGYSVGEQVSSIVADPYANADVVEANLDHLNDKYGECFGTTISNTGALIVSSESLRYDELEAMDDTCNSDSTERLQYSMYIADTIAAKTQNCYSGIDEVACTELGFGSAATPTPAPGGSTAGSTIVGDPYSSSVDVECAQGTTDLDIQTGYSGGVAIQYRMCAVPNLPSSSEESQPGSRYYVEGANGKAIVNSRVSGAMLAMVQAAAGATPSVVLTANSSFRTMQHQQDLWDANPHPDVVATPGFSSHQAGAAIDFTNMGVKGTNSSDCTPRTTAHGNTGWEWLFTNAENYGFKQYTKEPWHWDPLPTANRCDSSQP